MLNLIRQKNDAEIITVTGNLGQVSELNNIEAKALATGASKAYVLDIKKEFIEEYAWKALKSNALYEGSYPLATAIGRPLLAKKLVEVANQENAGTIAHGCTGKGNDQVRFEVGIQTLAPEKEIVAPLREWEFTCREEEIDYAIANNIPINISKQSPYSIDDNMWGMAIECGELEDTTVAPPEDAFQITQNPLTSKDSPDTITISFEKGIPTALNGVKYSPVDLVEAVNAIGSEHGIGRIDMVENRVVGIKSREIYEAPGAMILITAHKELEKLTLDKDTSRYKQNVDIQIANMIYDGQWFTPLFKSLSAFVDSTQEFVSGEVTLQLFKGNITVLSRFSEYSLYNEKLATYSSDDEFNHQDSAGFINLYSLPYKTIEQIHKTETKGITANVVGR